MLCLNLSIFGWPRIELSHGQSRLVCSFARVFCVIYTFGIFVPFLALIPGTFLACVITGP